MAENSHAQRVWSRFGDRFGIVDGCVPLFAANKAGVVSQRMIGRGSTARPVLARSPAMEALVIAETDKLVADWHARGHRYDGLIYCMGWQHGSSFIPVYIGKAETHGRGDGNLSANLKNLASDRSKFARWGDNYSYHIGDLSACVLPGHPSAKRTGKYEAWASTLFENAPSLEPRLRQPVKFWARAWESSATGIWEELGPTPVAVLEYLLIAVAGFVSPGLLNREGIGRSAG